MTLRELNEATQRMIEETGDPDLEVGIYDGYYETHRRVDRLVSINGYLGEDGVKSSFISIG